MTGDALVQREDDTAATLKKRLEIYHTQTARLIAYYNDWAASGDVAAPAYQKIAGVGPVKQICARVLAILQPQPR